MMSIGEILRQMFGGRAAPVPAAEPVQPPAPVLVHAVGDPDWPAILRAVGMKRPEFWAPLLAPPAARFAITRRPRPEAWAATLAHESLDGERLVENLNYLASALVAKFGARRGMTQDVAQRVGRLQDAQGRVLQHADQAAIANILYGGAWGLAQLGNSAEGDGWRFRGRGLMQLTGRANYRSAGKALGLDLEDDPDLASQPEVAAQVAAWFWAVEKRCNALADAGDMAAWRRAINGGDFGLDDVRRRYEAALRLPR